MSDFTINPNKLQGYPSFQHMNDFSSKQIEYVIFSDITFQEMYTLLKLKDII